MVSERLAFGTNVAFAEIGIPDVTFHNKKNYFADVKLNCEQRLDRWAIGASQDERREQLATTGLQERHAGWHQHRERR